MTGVRSALVYVETTVGAAETWETLALESIDSVDARCVVEASRFQAIIDVWRKRKIRIQYV